MHPSSERQSLRMPEWGKGAHLGRKGTPRLCKPSLNAFGDPTASHVGVLPFWVKWKMSHVSTPPWRRCHAWVLLSWTTQHVWVPPSWIMGHMRVLPSWNWARWWAKHALQVMCSPVRFSMQLVPVGRALLLKVMTCGPRVTMFLLLYACVFKSRDF